jgi:hypothetical protein
LAPLFSILALGYAQPAPAAIFSRAIRAHTALKAAAVQVRVESSIESAARATFDIAFIQPDKAVLRVRESAAEGGGTDRTFALLRSRLVGYDDFAHERLERKVSLKGSLADRLEAYTGPVGEPARSLLEAASMKQLMERFLELPGWKATSVSGGVQVVRSDRPTSTSMTLLFLADGRLSGADLRQGKSWVRWRLTYGSRPKALAYEPPPGALLVTAFTQRPSLPAGLAKDAKALVDRAARTYARLRYASWQVREGSAWVTVWVSGNRAKERAAAATWAYDGKALCVELKAQMRFYRGICAPREVLGSLRALGVEADSATRSYWTRSNPILTLISSDCKGRIVGSMSLDGTLCSILEIVSGNRVATLLVREKDGLLAQSSLEHRDESGRPVLRTERTYRYLTVGSQLPETVFRLQPAKGTPVLRLPPAKP